jgi:sialate O-acetylesterase
VVPLSNVGAPSTNLTGNWKVCNSGTAGSFSAAAFYFGRKVYQDQGTYIPVGLIVSSVGGTRIDPWLAPEGCTDIPVLAPLFSQTIVNYGPFSLFNGMIYPLAPYAMKGVVWYQGENGETTVQSADSYCLKMKALIQGWKRVFRLEDMAFYFVQIAHWGATPPSATPVLFSGAWDADTRLQQAAAMSLPHAGMASALDIGDSADMHPKDKLDLGERLAFWALKNDYGRTNLATSGPILRDVTVAGGKAICAFDHAGSGLMVGVKKPYQPTIETNSPLALFSIAGTDGIWYWATATVVGDTLELASPSVAVPKKIAYACWQNPVGVNLYNRDGLPASPFYVDDLSARFTIAAIAEAGGSISPGGTNTFLKRQTALYTITPDAGSYVLDVLVDGASVGAVKRFTFDPLYASHTIHATFTNALPAHRISATAGVGGSINPAGEVLVGQGGAQAFTITPNPGCLLSLVVDGQPMGARGGFTFSDITANHSIAAIFSCTIKASAGAGGKIVPSGTLTVPAGSNQTFAITPNAFYKIVNVQVDNVPQGPLTSYTFTNVSVPHTIGVGFALLPPTLTFALNASGGLEISWSDIYTASLFWSPAVGPGASWNSVAETPAHVGSFYKVTVTPGPGAIFYCLKQ